MKDVYTIEEIECVLEKLRKCIEQGRYSFQSKDGKERSKNENFLNAYIADATTRLSRIKSLRADEFSHAIDDNSIKNNGGKLYVFSNKATVCRRSDYKSLSIEIYIKFKIVEKCSGQAGLIISFHEAEGSLELYF